MTDNKNAKTVSIPLIQYGWLRSILFLITALIVSAIFTYIGMMVLALLFGFDFSSISTNPRDFLKDIGLLANITVSSFGFIGMLGTTWLFRRFIDRKTFQSLGFEFSAYKKDFITGFVVGFLLTVSGFVLLLILRKLSVDNFYFNLPLLIGYIILFGVGSFNEEIMIRGYILGNLSESMNKYIALIVSSLLFGVMHLANANVSAISFLNICLAGIMLGIYYVHKKNLWLPISLHFSWNFFQGPIFGFEVSGVDVTGAISQNIQGSDLITGGSFGFEGSVIATLLMLIAIVLLHFKYQEESN